MEVQGTALPVIQGACTSGDEELWAETDMGSGYYTLRVRLTGLCLDVAEARMNAGAEVVQYTCFNALNQQFRKVAQGGGFALQPRHVTGMCLGVDGAFVKQQVCTGAANQTWLFGAAPPPPPPPPPPPGGGGSWSTAPVSLPLVPVAAAHLPDGQVVFWSSFETLSFGSDRGNTQTVVYNPSTGVVGSLTSSNTQHDMFCPGIANLPDGRIHVTGGSSSTKTSIYRQSSPGVGGWSADRTMTIARGYQGAVTLSNGDVFTIGGSWHDGSNASMESDRFSEVWSPGATAGSLGTWRYLSSLSDTLIRTADPRQSYRANNHAWLFAGSNNTVFHAGPSNKMHWFNTAGVGSVTGAEVLRDGLDRMNGNAVMYDTRKILVSGGAPSYDNSPATAAAVVVDIGTNPPTTRSVGPMASPRAFHNSVVLPDGKVFVAGGQTIAVPLSDSNPVVRPELFDPAANNGVGAFAPMAVPPSNTPRTYHSVAILLPDTRVLVGGGGLCGSNCAAYGGDNHANFEIFTPPYGGAAPAARPAIQTNFTSPVTVGTSVSVTTDRAVNAFSLIRMSSVTHSVNNEQRRVPLAYAQTGTNQYLLSLLPNDRGVFVPGYYMLFALNNGVPSVAKIVRIQ